MQISMGTRGEGKNTAENLDRDLEEDEVEWSTTVFEVGGIVLVEEESSGFDDSASSARVPSDLEGVAG